MFNDLVIIGQGKVLLFTFNNVIGCGSIVDSMVFRCLRAAVRRTNDREEQKDAWSDGKCTRS